MGVYSVLVAVGFGSAFSVVGAYKTAPWQVVWSDLGYALVFGMAPLAWVLVRNTPEEYGLVVDGEARLDAEPIAPATGYTLGAALAEPAFWAFALATSMYGLITSGTSLLNQTILPALGFDDEMFYTLGIATTGYGLAGNFLAGWLVQRSSLRRVMGLSMTLIAAALFWLPQVGTFPQLIVIYAVGMALGGGMTTVVFFTAFGQVFGRLHLGKIQGIAQMLTVFSSALGPLLLAHCNARYASYMPFFTASAVVVVGLALWACFLKMPAPIESAIISPDAEAQPAVA